MITSKSAHAISKILFILGLYKFLAYLECITRYAWPFGHSDPDLSSVPTKNINCRTSEMFFPNSELPIYCVVTGRKKIEFLPSQPLIPRSYDFLQLTILFFKFCQYLLSLVAYLFSQSVPLVNRVHYHYEHKNRYYINI